MACLLRGETCPMKFKYNGEIFFIILKHKFMQRVGKIICCSLLILFMSNILLAQKIEFPEGFYINQKGQKIVGFFDLEGFRDNIITIRTSQDEKIGQPLVVDDVEKIVLEKGNKDSTVFLTQKLSYKGEEETIFLEYLLRGGINFLRGFSKNEREVFYISSTALPTLRRINKSNPKAFLFTYFQKCEDAKWQIKEVYYDKTSLEQALFVFARCLKTKTNKVVRLKDVKYDFKRQFSIGAKVIGGYLLPKSADYFGTKFKSNSATKGIGFNLQLSITNRISLSTEFNFEANSMTVKDSVNLWLSGGYGSKYLFQSQPIITYKKFEYIPLELKYAFPKEIRKYKPVVSLGFILNKIIEPEMTGQFGAYSEAVLNPYLPPHFTTVPPIPSSGRFLEDRNGFGVFTSMSLQRAVNKVLSYGFGFKYTLSKENIGLSVWTSENTNYFPLAHRLDLFGHLLFTIK